MQELVDGLSEAGLGGEDWTTGVRMLCAARSAGSPDAHDHPADRPGGAARTIGISAYPEEAEDVLDAWARAGAGRSASGVTVELE